MQHEAVDWIRRATHLGGRLATNRPHVLYLMLLSATYVCAAGLGQGLALIPGVSITFWPPVGIVVATLLSNERITWPWWLLAACAGELVANALWFGNSSTLAMTYFAANGLEAFTASWLILRFCPAPFRMQSFMEVAALVVLGAGVAPMVGATVIGVTDAINGKNSLLVAWPLAWLGDATGLLVSTPLSLVVMQTWRRRLATPTKRWLEGGIIACVLLTFGLASFRGYVPTLYMTLPPLLWAAVRFQFRGGAAALALLTLQTAIFATFSENAVLVDPSSTHGSNIRLQTFLGVSAVSTLIVAALSQQHRHALERLRLVNHELEARVTERTRTLRLSENRLALAVTGAHVGLFEWEIKTQQAHWSEEYARLLGVLPKAPASVSETTLVPGYSYELWRERVHPEDLARVEQQLERGQLSRAPLEIDYRIIRPDGDVRWLAMRGIFEFDHSGQAERLLGVAFDVTARKRAEHALREADRRKDEFLATLAHELRNPLAPVKNAVQILKLKGPQEPDMVWARDIIDRQVQAMARLIEDLMDLSRINLGRIELKTERVDLANILCDAVETSRPLIDSMQHQLVIDLPREPCILQGDATRLNQVFLNLLNNAAKYMEPGGTIRVTAERQGSDVEVKVTDAGIGIPVDRLEAIFEMFSQIEGTRSRSQGGLGIGLCLVKRLIELHGGSVAAFSDGVGSGSSFVVRLPLVVEAAESRQLPETSLRLTLPVQLNVLVVDDNQDAAESLVMLLRLMGHQVAAAHDGCAAVATALELRPDVILCDLGLPKLNGFEVCQQLRQVPWDKPLLMIAVTGWGQEADRRKSESAGFDFHLVKPASPAALTQLLSQFPPAAVQGGQPRQTADSRTASLSSASHG